MSRAGLGNCLTLSQRCPRTTDDRKNESRSEVSMTSWHPSRKSPARNKKIATSSSAAPLSATHLILWARAVGPSTALTRYSQCDSTVSGCDSLPRQLSVYRACSMCRFRVATDRRQTSPAKSRSSEPHLNLSHNPIRAVRVIRGSIQRSGLRTPSGSGASSIDRRRSSSRAGRRRARRRERGGRLERARFEYLSAPPVESTPCPGGRSR